MICSFFFSFWYLQPILVSGNADLLERVGKGSLFFCVLQEFVKHLCHLDSFCENFKKSWWGQSYDLSRACVGWIYDPENLTLDRSLKISLWVRQWIFCRYSRQDSTRKVGWTDRSGSYCSLSLSLFLTVLNISAQMPGWIHHWSKTFPSKTENRLASWPHAKQDQCLHQYLPWNSSLSS